MAIPGSAYGSEPLPSTWVNSVARMVADDVTVGAGGGAGDTTLTADEASYATLILTGVKTGNRNVIVPTDKRPWVIINNTSGAFTLTVKTAAGSGVVVANARTAILRCDGTNVLRVTADVAH